jgi:hypothetical protein
MEIQLTMVPMANEVREADVLEVFERHHTHYEVHPYYVVLDQRPAGGRPVEQRIQAGFDVDLYGTLEREQVPVFHGEEARIVISHCRMIAQQIQAKIGRQCTIEVIPSEDSIVLDTHHHLDPEALLRIRISHERGLDQPKGPAEEEALKALQEALQAVQVKQA